MRLPYGVQGDEADATAAVAFIEPHATLTVDIKPAVDAPRDAATTSDDVPPEVADFVKGNIKALAAGMVAQYAAAGLTSAAWWWAPTRLPRR